MDLREVFSTFLCTFLTYLTSSEDSGSTGSTGLSFSADVATTTGVGIAPDSGILAVEEVAAAVATATTSTTLLTLPDSSVAVGYPSEVTQSSPLSTNLNSTEVAVEGRGTVNSNPLDGVKTRGNLLVQLSKLPTSSTSETPSVFG